MTPSSLNFGGNLVLIDSKATAVRWSGTKRKFSCTLAQDDLLGSLYASSCTVCISYAGQCFGNRSSHWKPRLYKGAKGHEVWHVNTGVSNYESFRLQWHILPANSNATDSNLLTQTLRRKPSSLNEICTELVKLSACKYTHLHSNKWRRRALELTLQSVSHHPLINKWSLLTLRIRTALAHAMQCQFMI